MTTRRRLALLALATSLVLACGAGGDGDTAPTTVPPTPGSESTTTTEPTAPVSVEPVHEVTVERGLVYTTAQTASGPVELAADVYRPDAEGRFAGMVFVHGGGFVTGRRDQQPVADFSEELAARGVVVASISYRLVDDEPVTSERVAPILEAMDGANTGEFLTAVLASVDDTIAAMDWFVGEADTFSVDPERVFAGGSSAGAIAVLQAVYNADEFGVEVPPVRAVVDLWGALFLLPGDVSVIEADEPPVFVLHGTEDEIVPFEEGQSIADRAETIGLRHELVAVPGAGHAWGATDFFAESYQGGPSFVERIAGFLEAS